MRHWECKGVQNRECQKSRLAPVSDLSLDLSIQVIGVGAGESLIEPAHVCLLQDVCGCSWEAWPWSYNLTNCGIYVP